jgi:hypothetical protein
MSNVLIAFIAHLLEFAEKLSEERENFRRINALLMRLKYELSS